MTPELLTTKTAAARLRITPRRVVALIQAGRLPARRLGRDWLIEEPHLAAIAVRKPGRPQRRLSRGDAGE
jgi:excisionase family DNA binding protein